MYLLIEEELVWFNEVINMESSVGTFGWRWFRWFKKDAVRDRGTEIGRIRGFVKIRVCLRHVESILKILNTEFDFIIETHK